MDFVAKVTTKGSPDFVPVAERIAVFDHVGTLWAEKPIPFQAFFALDRVKALAPQHPEWRTQEPFASLLKGDAKAALAGGERAVGELLMATHAGMTADEFTRIVSDWIATAKHPKTGRLGWKVCTIACPFGTVNYVVETGKVQNCELCGGDPACPSPCPAGAITYVDADWTGLDKMRQWAGKTDTQPRANA